MPQQSKLELKDLRGPRGLPLVGNFRFTDFDPLEQMEALQREYGDLIPLKFLNQKALLISHPDGAQAVFQTKASSMSKQTLGYRQLKLFLGEGLLTADGEHWRKQRRISQPAFHREQIAKMVLRMDRIARESVDQLVLEAKKFGWISVLPAMSAITLRVVCETLLGASKEINNPEIYRALTETLEGVNEQMMPRLHAPMFLPTRQNLAFQRGKKKLDDLVYGIIEKRRRGERNDDLLQMFIDAKDEDTGLGMSDIELRDEVMTMVLAGHETTANALTWALLELARRPDAFAAVAKEADLVLASSEAEVSSLAKLEESGRVISEAMRLHPPVYVLGRLSEEPVEIMGCIVPPKTMTVVSIARVHRHPAFWERPDEFLPERFSKESQAKFHRSQYLPFAQGPRMCIGSLFATYEAKLVLARFAQRLELDGVQPAMPKQLPQITLRPVGNAPLRFRECVSFLNAQA